MNKTLGLAAILLLVGAGCAQTNVEEVNTNETSEVSEITNDGPVPFAEIETNVLNQDKKYSEFRYTEETGDCSEKGAPKVVSYFKDADLGYFIVESGDGDYRDEFVVALANNYVVFDEVVLPEGNAKCKIQIKQGEETGTYVCSVDETEVCSSVVSGVGILN